MVTFPRFGLELDSFAIAAFLMKGAQGNIVGRMPTQHCTTNVWATSSRMGRRPAPFLMLLAARVGDKAFFSIGASSCGA
jgi:hypothetical protein